MAPERVRRGPPVQRMFFEAPGGVLTIPPETDEAAKKIISGYRTFDGASRRGDIRIVDLRLRAKGEAVVNSSWGPVRGSRRRERGDISATVIYAGAASPEKGEIAECLARQQQLAPLFIVEQGRKSVEEKKKREDFLRGLGLVDVTVSSRETDSAPLTISRARRRKPTRRTPVDITTTRADHKLKQGEERERRAAKNRGAELVSDRPARELAAASTNIPRDASNLADGRGRTWRESCGCEVETDLKGATTVRQHCKGGACVLRSEVETNPIIPWEQLRTLSYIVFSKDKKVNVGETFTNGRRRYRVTEAQ
ncbi:MAG: hypothetical protein ABH867_05240, partial [Patescibacteria group bacterium]